jgi:hypothetical protein
MYEPGCYAVVDGRPQSTPLTDVIRATAHGADPVAGPGWWRRADRTVYRFDETEESAA